MSLTRIEPLYVLYGSQMGNSEQAAKEFCEQLPTKYTKEFFQSNGLPPIEVKATCIQLDDFLEMEHADFTKCVVIFVSSYGVGQAPLGAMRFRQICDALSEDQEKHRTALEGLKFALCGLGSSTYTTYLKNPTAIFTGLKAAGAEPIVEMAKADAFASGNSAQDKIIARWIEKTWVPLAKALCAEDPVDTKAMQSHIIPMLVKLDPDYSPPKGALLANHKQSSASIVLALGLPALVVLLAIAVMYLK